SVEIFAFAPGIDASKVDITLDRGVLTLSGERPNDVPESNDQVGVYSRERLRGSFRRAVNLPDDIDLERVNATYRDGLLRISLARYRRSFTLSRELDASRIEANLKDGVLTLRIPKQALPQPRRIAVQVG